MGALLTPAYQPFAIAGAVLLGLVLIEAAAVVIGASFSDAVESFIGVKDVPGEGAGPLTNGLDWLNGGRVPFIVLLMILLGLFTALGLALQLLAAAVAAPLPGAIAALVAGAATIPLTRMASRLLGRFIPRDETYAIDDDHFVGRTGVVTVGPVQDGAVARIKIQDHWGNWHFPRVRPAKTSDVLPEGTAVLVVDRVGRELAVIEAEARLRDEASAA